MGPPVTQLFLLQKYTTIGTRTIITTAAAKSSSKLLGWYVNPFLPLGSLTNHLWQKM